MNRACLLYIVTGSSTTCIHWQCTNRFLSSGGKWKLYISLNIYEYIFTKRKRIIFPRFRHLDENTSLIAKYKQWRKHEVEPTAAISAVKIWTKIGRWGSDKYVTAYYLDIYVYVMYVCTGGTVHVMRKVWEKIHKTIWEIYITEEFPE
jgi:hypothetical protein